MKRCPSCGDTKSEADFGQNRSSADGLSFYCLQCNRARNNRWYRQSRESRGLAVRDHSWVPEGFRWCPSCRQAVAHEDYVRNARTASGFGSRCRPCDRAANSAGYFYRTYKLTPSELADLRSAQQNRCGICGDEGPQHLDHDHSTGQIRRLLCQRCNHGLGLFRDDPYLLHVAALYVEGHRQTHAHDLLRQSATASGALSQPGEPPVGSHRRPGAAGTGTRSTGRTTGARRREQAGEADT